MAGAPPSYPPGPPDPRTLKYQQRMMKAQLRAQRMQYRYQMRGTRRTSIVGPLMVVLVGVLFLLVQLGHIPAEHLWDWYGRWWPLLLILLGVILLAEWAFDQPRARDAAQPYPRRGVGPGIILLIVLFALAGVAASTLHANHPIFVRGFGLSLNPDDLEQFIGDKHESDESRVETLPANGSLTIDNPRGEVVVTGVSADNQVHIDMHRQVYSHSDSDAERKAGELTPHVSTSGSELSISVPSVRGCIADLTITVPAAAAVTINASHGDVHADGLHAPVTVTANHGDVMFSSVRANVVARINQNDASVSAHDIGGNVTIEGRGDDLTLSDITGSVNISGDYYGTTHLEHVAGATRFHTSRTELQLARLDGELEISSDDDLSVDQAVGPVTLTTRNRNITMERVSGDIAVTNHNGSVELTGAPPIGNVNVQNRNGSVTVTMPEKADFAVNAETTDGEVHNDFGLPMQDTEKRMAINGTVGKGGSLVRIHTTQGDVAVRKASVAPLPPKPPSMPMPPEPPPMPSPDKDDVRILQQSDDGSSISVGKDGTHIVKSADGSIVITGKNGHGLRIARSADGSSSYKSDDGTRLTEGADGTKVYIGRDGSRYTETPDGGKLYKGSDGTRITISPDGSQIARGPGGKTFSPNEISDRLRRISDEIHGVEQERDQQIRK